MSEDVERRLVEALTKLTPEQRDTLTKALVDAADFAIRLEGDFTIPTSTQGIESPNPPPS